MHSADSSIEAVARSSVLAASRPIIDERLSIAVPESGARFSLRLRTSSGVAAGLAWPASCLPPMPINTCIALGGGTIARLGPDEWLVLCRDADAERLASEFTPALRPASFSLTDIGHRDVGLLVRGLHAREVLNGGCPLDLSDAQFPPGSATRTVFGKSEIVLLRPGVEMVYRVECWRSFAPYVYSLLRHCAREFAVC